MGKKAATADPVGKEAYIYDLEQFSNMHLACFKSVSTGKRRWFVLYHDLRDSKHSINQINEYIEFIETEVLTLIGYNNHDYDDIMLKHILINKIMFTKNVGVEDIVSSLKVLNDRIISRKWSEKQSGKKDKYIANLKAQKKFSSIDLYLLFNTVDRTGLKQVAINLRWHNIIDLPFHPDHIVVSEEIETITHYCWNDVDITEMILQKKQTDIKFRKELGGLYNINIINSNDTNVAKAVIRKFYCQATGREFKDFKDDRTFYNKIYLNTCISPKIRFMTHKYQKLLNRIRNTSVLPFKKNSAKEEKQFEYIMVSKYLTHTIGLGGIHSNNPSEELRETDEYEYIDADVKAFYPYLIVNEGLYPKHLGPEFTRAYGKYIVNKRMDVKKLIQDGINVEDNKIIDAGLKITANSTFGLMKSVFSWLYDPQVATYICISGQLFLLMLIERLEEMTDCVVVYSNTDGITTRVPKGSRPAYERICNQWMKATGFDLEFVNYRRMVMMNINNYLMVTSDKNKPVKQVGLFLEKKPLKSSYIYPIVAKALNKYYVDGIAVELTIKSENDTFEFIKAVRTSTDKFDTYLFPMGCDKAEYKPPKMQVSNRWIVTHGFKEEGHIVKRSLKDDTETHMQKGRRVTIVNDMRPYMDVAELRLDYNFYESECVKVIKEIHIREKETHNNQYKQATIF